MAKQVLVLSALLTAIIILPVFASDFSSTNFNDLNPILLIEAGKSTSTNFQLISGTGQTVVGESSSTNFGNRSGFFYFPTVTTPVLAATAGDGQVTLTWTSAVGQLGFNVTSYEVGKSTASGGPYAFTNYGNVLTKAITSLTNGVNYYFVIRVNDALGNSITTSTEASAKPVAASTPAATVTTPASGGGGGGGGGGGAPPAPTAVTTVNISGRAYPLSKVSVLKDAQLAITTIAGPDSNFSVSLTNLTAGSYTFSLYGEDSAGRRSTLFSFPVTLAQNATTNITGVFISPTIDVNKSQVKRGDDITIFGQAAPASEVVISVHSDNEYFVKTKSDPVGAYLYKFDTVDLEYGQHFTKAKAALNSDISAYSRAVGFLVGKSTVASKPEPLCPNKADLNNDCRVNLVDFSIAAYWYKRAASANFLAIEKAELNGDGKINLTDFSILAYYWTG